MRHLLFFLFILYIIDNSFAQKNYINNSSFEDTVTCPTAPAQISRAMYWDTLSSGGGISPDFFHSCFNPNTCGVPFNHNNNGFQYPKTGQAHAGFQTAGKGSTVREYIQTKLNQKLKSGETYCVKFFVNLANYATGIVKPIGAYFDDGSVMTYTNFGLAYANAFNQLAIPQVYNTTQVLNDTLNWIKIEGSFVALGTEENLTIGNFFPDSLSEIVYWSTFWFSYYQIDDVSVIDANLPAYAGNDTLIQPGDSVFIGRQPEIGLDEDCIWFANGVPIDTVAGLWVQPDTTTTYVVQQTICGNVKWDTVTVSVDTGVGMAAFELNQRFKVYPNPATNLLTIESPISNGTLSISNLLGQEVLRLPINDKVSQIDISKLGKGVYFVRLEGRNGFMVRKVMIE